MEINFSDMNARQSNVGYEMAYYLSKKLDKSITEVLQLSEKRDIIVTTNKSAFAIYTYKKSISKIGIKNTKLVYLYEVLLWLDFVVLPNESNIYNFKIYTFKQDGEIHYIYVKSKGEK